MRRLGSRAGPEHAVQYVEMLVGGRSRRKRGEGGGFAAPSDRGSHRAGGGGVSLTKFWTRGKETGSRSAAGSRGELSLNLLVLDLIRA